jgi:general secretion pathway protein M
VIAGWWQKQSERDQRVLAVGAALIALLLAWAFVWYPLARARAQLESRVEHERTDLAWMLQSGGELQELRAKGARGKVDRQGKSLFALADVTARGAGLATALKRVEPTGSRSVRASFEAADFDALIGWVDVLARDYAVQTTDFSADRVEAIGTVNARVVLEEP